MRVKSPGPAARVFWAAVLILALSATLGGCAGAQLPSARAPVSAPTSGLADRVPADWPQAPVVLLGEQHDAPAHRALAIELVQRLSAQGRLQALALEMVEQGRSTAGLSADASQAQVRTQLGWAADGAPGWPWADYGPLVMTAVRAGVPVVGANLPRERLRAVMREPRWDTQVPEPVRQVLIHDVRQGHCDLLPAEHLPAMARVQIARDAAMADTVAAQAQAQMQTAARKTVLLLAGALHVARDRGVPVHLARSHPGLAVQAVGMIAGDGALAGQGDGAGDGVDRGAAREGAGSGVAAAPVFDKVWRTPAVQRADPCEQLRQQWRARPPGA